MSRQKYKYLENEKNFENEIKSIFHQFYKAFIEANKKNFFVEHESPTLMEIKKQRVNGFQ